MSFSANLRIDAANSVQVSASRAFDFNGKASHTGITVSYTHRFGAGSGGGFQFSSLLGLGRGRIQGHVFMDLNSNGHQDPDERGIAGMKIQLDGSKSVVTDSRGEFSFRALDPGDFDVALISDQLGLTLRASSATSQNVSLAPNQTINLNFGLTNSGFVAGRVFNDLRFQPERVLWHWRPAHVATLSPCPNSSKIVPTLGRTESQALDPLDRQTNNENTDCRRR